MSVMPLRYLFVVPIIAAPALAADVQTLSGKRVSGDVVGLDRQTIVLKSADGEIRHPLADILLVGLNPGDQPPAGAFLDLELTDGSVLHCTKLEFKPQSLDVTAAADIALSVPYRMIATLCKDAHDPKNKIEVQQFAGKRGRYDMGAIRSEGKLNALEGTLGGGIAPGDGIEFTIAGTEQKATPRLAKIAGLVFVIRPNTSAPPPLCKVVDGARNSLIAADVIWNETGLAVTTVSGLKVTYNDPTRL